MSLFDFNTSQGYNYGLPEQLEAGVVNLLKAAGVVSTQVDPITGAQSVVSVDGTSLLRDRLAFESLLSKNGAVLSGSVDDSAAIQAAYNAFTVAFPGARAVFSGGGTIARLESGLSLDISKGGVDFNGLELRPIGAITALTINGSAASPFGNGLHCIERFTIRGEAAENDAATAVTGQRGIYHNNPDAVAFGNGPSNFAVRSYLLTGLDIGEEYGNAAWGIKHYEWAVSNCKSAAIKSPSGLVDAYELPIYYGGTMANNIEGIVMADGQLTFVGSSFDYNRYQGRVTKGRVLLIGCHVETNMRRSAYGANHRPWVLSGTGSLIMQGGRLAATPGSGTQMDYMFDVATGGNYDGGVFLDRVTMKGVDTSSGLLATGAGTCVARGCILSEGSAASVIHPKGVHATKNLLVSGNFENGFPNDDWFVSAGGTLSSRVASTNVGIAIGAGAARNGGNGLIITKNVDAGAAGTADICVLRRIEGQDQVHSGRLWIRAPSSTAQVTVQYGYFGATDLVVGSDVVYTLRSADTVPMLPSAGVVTLSTKWQEVYADTPYRRPTPGLPYVGFRIRAHALGPAEVCYIDDVEIHPW